MDLGTQNFEKYVDNCILDGGVVGQKMDTNASPKSIWGSKKISQTHP